MLARAPQVGVDDHDRRMPICGERDGEVGDDGRLALRRVGARDLDARAGGVVEQELDVGAQRPVALLEVVGRRSGSQISEAGAARERALARRGGRAPARRELGRSSAAVSIRRRKLLEREREQDAGEQAEQDADAEQISGGRGCTGVVGGDGRVDERWR